MSDRPHIRVELLSNPVYLCGARELVASVSKRLGFDDLDCSKIALAVDEALCNIIRHGYQRRTDGQIWISIWPVEGPGETKPCGIRIIIEDEARQVDPDQVRGRELADVRPGGLGVHIIREVMDEAVYERREPRGMRLTLVKRCQTIETPARLAHAASAASLKRQKSPR